MKAVRQRDTEAEMLIRREVHGMGLRYRVDRTVVKGSKRRADMVFAKARVAVFVDG